MATPSIHSRSVHLFFRTEYLASHLIMEIQQFLKPQQIIGQFTGKLVTQHSFLMRQYLYQNKRATLKQCSFDKYMQVVALCYDLRCAISVILLYVFACVFAEIKLFEVTHFQWKVMACLALFLVRLEIMWQNSKIVQVNR